MPKGSGHLCKRCGEVDPEKFQLVLARRGANEYREKSMCKKCRNRTRTYRTPEQRRATHLKRLYGITPEQYDFLLFEVQGGVCPCCGRTQEEACAADDRRWPVDHNHDTGKVRGILCNNCNQGLGQAQDDVEVLRGMIRYLEGSK